MVKDRLMCGINDQQIQKKLLAEKVLSFVKTLEIAVAVEYAIKGARDITSGMSDNTTLHHFSDRPPPVINIKCFHCGRSNHRPAECYFKDALSRKCKRKGHIECLYHSRHKLQFLSPASGREITTSQCCVH